MDAFAKTVPLRCLKQWMAYWMVEPFGDDWSRTGKLAAIVAAASGNKVEADFGDRFLPSYRPPQQTEAEMLAELRKIPGFAEQMDEKGL